MFSRKLKEFPASESTVHVCKHNTEILVLFKAHLSLVNHLFIVKSRIFFVAEKYRTYVFIRSLVFCLHPVKNTDKQLCKKKVDISSIP